MPSETWVASQHAVETVKKTDKIYGWIRRNRETVIGSAVILLAVIAFAIYFVANYRSLRDAAWRNLFIAQQNAYSGNIENAQKLLTEIQKTYGRTSAAPFAALTEGDIFYALGRFDDAAVSYNKVLSSGEKTLYPIAMLDLGKSKEAKEDWTGARDVYFKFVEQYPNHYTTPEVHMSLANAYLKTGDTTAAKAAFERIAVLYPDTAWSAQAKAVLTAGEKKETPKTAAQPASKQAVKTVVPGKK